MEAPEAFRISARMMAAGYGAPNRPGVPFCTHVEGGSLSCDDSARPSSRHCCVGGLFVPAAFAASPAAHAVPKVVFIVGPAGAATSGYRAQARSAAAIARQYTPDVVELYSPNATWTAVKDALKGASLVVYMGHGNGWPSRYRDSLYPITQDGFGLNPTAGGGDYQHQYFGEASIASEVKLAKNAVVLLNHLCYASGNSEPGLPEGTLDVAKQRVDNYAAGFIRAGASAVIAEAWSSPSYFVRAILGGGRSIQSAWLKSPSANGNRIAFPSQRSAGYVAQMDPESASSGFERSIVMKSGLAPKDVLAGAAGSAHSTGAPAAPLVPTLSGTGLTLAVPDIASVTSAGSTVNLDVPFTIKDRKALPKGLQASVRWDPIALAIAPVDPATEVAPGIQPRRPAPRPLSRGPRRRRLAKPSAVAVIGTGRKGAAGASDRGARPSSTRRPRRRPSSSPRRPATSSRRPPSRSGRPRSPCP